MTSQNERELFNSYLDDWVLSEMVKQIKELTEGAIEFQNMRIYFSEEVS